ncbi:MAG: DNA-deoxyinosine glycosylase [Chromatiales bacterium]|nr:DNA-deoxyinosine glycosylase [Chromatiales bacterium]
MLQGFPPIARPNARLLILGSMPGQRSLAEQQYYAQPQNAFWIIMGALFGADPTLPYAERCARLAQGRVALWDVLARCHRPGSLDQKIRLRDAELNDFDSFFEAHRLICAVACNGQLAARLFRQRVVPRLRAGTTLQVHVLPSTSPALASMTAAEKIERWRQTLAPWAIHARAQARRAAGQNC